MNHHYITSTKTLLAITKRWKRFKRNEYKANGKVEMGKWKKQSKAKGKIKKSIDKIINMNISINDYDI